MALAVCLRRSRAASGRPAIAIARRCLGDSVSGPPITDLQANLQRASEFFTKSAVSYAEFKQQCVSLRIFAFAGVTTGCVLALIVSPPKSSYWMRWSPTYWYSHLKSMFRVTAPPVFLVEKQQHEEDVGALVASVVEPTPAAEVFASMAEKEGTPAPAAAAAEAPAEPVVAAVAVEDPAVSKAPAPVAEEPVAAQAPAVEPAAAPAEAREAGADIAELEERVAALEVFASPSEKKQHLADGAARHSAFVFIKPHAVCDKVKELVKLKLELNGISILSEGTIPAERIDEQQLIDTHYGAIAAKAVKVKPAALTVQAKAQDGFQKAFGLSWSDALQQGLVFNAMDATAKLGISTEELGAKWGTLKKDVNLLKFGGGFYCGKVDGIYVINGFYMDMRSKFTTPGTCIHYYTVDWSPSELSWADFRSQILGTTDPKTADMCSARHLIYSNWQGLGLKACPDTGDNGVHASASPFEALAERANWLGVPLTEDTFGKAMLAAGVPMPALRAWCDDPAVSFAGKKQSLFDLLEDLDGAECLQKSAQIASANR